MSIPRKDVGVGYENMVAYENCYQYNITFNETYPEDKPWTWPKRPDKSWPIIYCAEGWEYDRSEYENSLVTEVSSLLKSNDFVIQSWNNMPHCIIVEFSFWVLYIIRCTQTFNLTDVSLICFG